MVSLIKFIIICLAIYLFFKLVVRTFLIYVVRRQLGKMQDNMTQQTASGNKHHRQNEQTKNTHNTNQPFKGGDYIDYEEVN